MQQPTAAIKAHCLTYEWKGITFWMFPFRLMVTQTAIELLNEIEPQIVYVNRKTKERVYEKPDALKRAEAKAEVLKIEPKSEWEVRNLWQDTHRCFVICDTATVAIDFPDTDASAEIGAFREYWQTRSADVGERWDSFKLLMGQEISGVWWKAFNATRDNPAPAPAELGQAAPKDPLAENTPIGESPVTTTSDLSETS